MKALFRCDATASIGFGHLSRCIALAEAFRELGVASKFAGQYDDAAKDQIADAGFEHIDHLHPVNSSAEQSADGVNCAEHRPDFVIVDSYSTDAQYLTRLGQHTAEIAVIDDFCELAAYPCDAVLNFTWEAPRLAYPNGPTLVLGHNNLLARRRLVERRQASIARDRQGPVRNLLVAIGGADPKGLVDRVLRNLPQGQNDICVRAIATETPELIELLSQFAEGSGCLPRQPDLSEALLWADAAITGGGLIKYESAFMGVPAAAIAQNEGQDGETKAFKQAGLVFDLGLADSVSDEDLKQGLNSFVSNEAERANMIAKMRDAFVPDPTMHAAEQLLEAMKP